MNFEREAAARAFASEAEIELTKSGTKVVRTRVEGNHIQFLLERPPADGQVVQNIAARAVVLDFDFSVEPTYYLKDDGLWPSDPE